MNKRTLRTGIRIETVGIKNALKNEIAIEIIWMKIEELLDRVEIRVRVRIQVEGTVKDPIESRVGIRFRGWFKKRVCRK